MQPSRNRLATAALAVGFLTGGAFLLYADKRATPPPLPVPVPRPTPLAPELYAQAAAALRAGNLALAEAAAKAVVTRAPGQGVHTSVVTGLYAYTTGSVARARQLLGAAPAADRSLEDWRLFALAESAAAVGATDEAVTALGQLLAGHRESPLRPRAYWRAASLLRDQGDAAGTLELVRAARDEQLEGEFAVALEELAWRVGVDTGVDEVRQEAARALLIRAPVTAASLGIEVHLEATGSSWDTFLTAPELRQRAAAFLAADEPLSALTTLAAVGDDDRDAEWHFLEAEALTRSNRGDQAIEALREVEPRTPGERARLAWNRAMAAADLAVAVRGRENLSAAGRAQMRRLANQHLQQVADLDADRELTRQALAELYSQRSDDGNFDQAVATLRQLRAIDARDTTGARNLWERGWQEYRRNNHSGAVGYWSLLDELYPETGDAHRGRYWKARAFEGLGERVRASELYQRIVAAADTADFYRRQALARLGGGGQGVEPVADEPWTIDPLLARARALSELGLDGLAMTELELLGDRPAERDRLALRGIVLARQGDRVNSVLLLRQAFPALGGSMQAAVPEEIRKNYYPLLYADALRSGTRRTGVPMHLLAGIIRQESAFDPRATSRVGARGLMQLMPATGREVAGKLGVAYSTERLYDPEYSVMLGSTYFKQVLDGFDGNLELALAGYNGGPNRIRRMWKSAGQRNLDLFVENLALEESKTYVKRVLVLSDSYRQLYPDLVAAPPPVG